MKTGITLAFAAIGALGGTGVLTDVQVPFISSGYTPPAECVAWYNGCNMCEQNADGGTSCTNRICESRGRGFCTEYASSTPQTS